MTDDKTDRDDSHPSAIAPSREGLSSPSSASDGYAAALAGMRSDLAADTPSWKRSLTDVVRDISPAIEAERRKRPRKRWSDIAEIVERHGFAATPDAVRIAFGRVRQRKAVPGLIQRMNPQLPPIDTVPLIVSAPTPLASRARDPPVGQSPHDKRPRIARRVK